MLAKRYKLPVQAVAKKTGRATRTGYFSLKIFPKMPKTAGPASRFGVVIGNSVSKRATVRNKIKRIIFWFFSEKYADFPPADYLVIIHRGVAALTRKQIIDDLEKLTKNILNQ